MTNRLNQPECKKRGCPVVSVVIPTYNRAKFVGTAIASVLGQSYKCFELIVIDDGSVDATDQIVGSFSDSRLIYVRQTNRGRSAARNNAINMARGRYIAFLDSDDEYLQDKLLRQVTYMDTHSEIGMIYTSAECTDASGKLLEKHAYIATTEGEIYRDVAFFRPVTITLPTVMLRREVLETVGLFDEAMERFEDTDMWRRIAKRFRIEVIESPTCRLRTHHENHLIAQDPNQITSAINYYIEKVFREDADMDAAFLKHGASRLLEYYGKAFVGVAGWRFRGIVLLGRAVAQCPSRAMHVVISGAWSLLRSLVKSSHMPMRRVDIEGHD